ncbi:MAG: TetR/AcrR family transcriptional regulator [Proteobacteria bacterium]|nr:TetR/AcrR family transcriptional regulator [Pseudomonadota bacterium]
MPAKPLSRPGAPSQDRAASATGKERLLQAAIELFGRDGFDGTSVRAIADHAGVSFALIRASYGSKEGLREAAEKVVFEDMIPIWTFSGEESSSEEVIDFIRSQAETFDRLAGQVDFIRRCILEQRPAANAFMARMMVAQGEAGGYRLQEAYPQEAWLRNPLRQLMVKLGYVLIAPNIRQILGVDLMSREQLERINLEEARLWRLVAAGLAAEKQAAQKATAG